jgi:hypothetical protein
MMIMMGEDNHYLRVQEERGEIWIKWERSEINGGE